MIDAMGREGRQATRPNESPTQDEVSGRSQGSCRMPRSTNHIRRISSSGDSSEPAMAFISWPLASDRRKTSFCCAVRNRRLVRSTLR